MSLGREFEQLGKSAVYTAVEAPITSLGQLFDESFQFAPIKPEAARAGTADYTMQFIGNTVGLLTDLALFRRGANWFSDTPLASKVGIDALLKSPVGFTATSGLLYGGLLTPVQASDGGQWWQRGKNAALMGSTFALAGWGGQKLAERLPLRSSELVPLNRLSVEQAIDSAQTDGGSSLVALQQQYETVPPLERASVWATNRPAVAGEPSGDLMKVFTGSDGKIHLFSGDVAGHGLDAGKVSVRLNQALSERSPALAAEGTGAADWLASAEPDLHTQNGSSTMAMVSHIALNPASGEAEVATAGQNLVYRVQPDGTVTSLHSANPPLGIDMQDMLQGRKVQLGQGDMVVATSDGAYSRFGDDFGEGYEAYLKSLGPNATPEQITNDIFSRAARKPDDTSVMILRWPG